MEGSDREGDGTALIGGRKGLGRAGEESGKVTPPPHGIALERLNQRIQLYAYRNDDGLIGAVQRTLMGWPSLKPTINPKTKVICIIRTFS